MTTLNDQALLRYSRQIMLPGFDIAGQEALAKARVLVVGLGGLGSAAVLYLAAAGIRELVLADPDIVELSNLQRQIIYRQDDQGTHKVFAASKAIEALNSGCNVQQLPVRLAGQMLLKQVANADLVLDCTDNFTSRSELNSACLQHSKPMVTAAAINMTGQLTVFDPRQATSPCYRCLYGDVAEKEEASCSENGIMGPVVGLLGVAQAIETIKVLANFGEPLVGKLQTFDAVNMQWHSFRLPKRAGCKACGTTATV